MYTPSASPIGAGGRLNGIVERAHDARAEMVAERIRADLGSVRGAMADFDVCYSHACRIRAGWRPSGVHVDPIPYESRGWTNGRRNGWSGHLEALK